MKSVVREDTGEMVGDSILCYAYVVYIQFS